MADRQAQLTTAPRLTFVLKSSSPPPTFAGRLYGMIRREGVPSTSGFSNTRQLLRHFADHGAEFGANSAAEYEAMADAFLGQPKTAHVHECARKSGDTIRFDPFTEAYGVLASNQVIRTYFKPVACSAVPTKRRKAVRLSGRCHSYPNNLLYFRNGCSQ